MDAESDNDDNTDDDFGNGTMSHSLFYSTQQQQQQQSGEESIALTDSHGYSDRSQLLFSQESLDEDEGGSHGDWTPSDRLDYSTYEESPVRERKNRRVMLGMLDQGN
jgi:hypothetical protein